MLYLDHNATTPVDSRVLDSMLPYLQHRYGNAASPHLAGRAARAAVGTAREHVSLLVGAPAAAIVWTSGATESLSTIVKGIVGSGGGTRRHFVYGVTEHKAVLDSLTWVSSSTGLEVAAGPVRGDGTIDLEALDALVDHETLAVCVMAANNESGVLSNVPAVSAIARAAGALVICDATQQVGKLPIGLSRARRLRRRVRPQALRPPGRRRADCRRSGESRATDTVDPWRRTPGWPALRNSERARDRGVRRSRADRRRGDGVGRGTHRQDCATV